MSLFSENDVVWVPRTPSSQSHYWPAVVANPNPGQFSVRLVGQTNRRRSLPSEVVPFTQTKPGKYLNSDLQKAVKQACKQARHPRVSIDKAEVERFQEQGSELPRTIREASKNIKQVRVSLDKTEIEKFQEESYIKPEMGKEWKDDFLESLDSDEEEENKENQSRNKEKKTKLKDILAPKKNSPAKKSASTGAQQPLSTLLKESKKQNLKDEPSEYEKMRLKNIAERQAVFAQLKKDFAAYKKDTLPKPQQRNYTGGDRKRVFARRSLGVLQYSSRSEPVRTRHRSRLNSEGSSEQSSGRSTPVKRLWEGGIGEDGTVDTEEWLAREEAKRPRFDAKVNPHVGRWAADPNVEITSPDEITEDMLANVADRVSEKVYNSATGTTCHQCRQKTCDTKTVCRSGHCVGVRGMFCGVCLLNRYGEDARLALKDPNWMCPPCLDICNCSICRNRLGKGATGPITWLAQEKGYSNVKDYLDALKPKTERIVED